jgi:hypothetical protein
VGNLGQGNLNQQKLVSLFDAFSAKAAPVQTAYGQCTSGVSYWDIGVRGDTGPTNHTGGLLNPTYSVITSTAGYASTNHTTAPSFISQYCNGSRVPPTCTVADGCGGPSGYGVPPGIVDASSPNPVFSLTPSATVDEGNNWINVSWGPLSLSDDSVVGGGPMFANYAPAASFDSTPAAIPTTEPNYSLVPKTDYFGNLRPEAGDATHFDPGAIEVGSAAPVVTLSVTGGPLAFGNWAVGTVSSAKTLTLHNTGTGAGTGITLAFSSGVFSQSGGTCTTTLAAGATCTINVVFSPTAAGADSGTLTILANAPVTGSPVALSGTGVATQATVSITPNPLTITLATGSFTGTGTVTLTNTAAAGGAQVSVTNVTVAGGTILTYFFNAVAGANTCTGATLAPGASCTVGVRFTNVLSPRGVNRAGTITFTDDAVGSTQVGNLIGHAN